MARLRRRWRRKGLTLWSIGYLSLQGAGGLLVAGLFASAGLVAVGAIVLMLAADAPRERRGSGSRMTPHAKLGRAA